MVIQMNFCLIKKNFPKLDNEFLNFIEDKRLIIHNAEFDLAHLNNELSLIWKKENI
jgi:DNA polymerase-3 subunit epsilon